jgi:hypothetical protein
MSEIRIGGSAQLVGAIAVIGAVGAVVAKQLPELQRYLKIRQM